MRFKIVFLLSIISVISLFLYLMCYSENKSENGDPFRINGENRLRNIKMLTDSGENAEAYLSFNEQMLIYQTTTENWECDQQLWKFIS